MTPTATVVTTYAIRGTVFEDSDGNGVREPSETAGVPGVTIRIWQGGSLVATVVTDGSGAYDVPGLPAGATIVEELQPPGYVSTTPDNVALDLTADVAVDFGEQPLVATPTPTATPIPVTMELRVTYRYLLWYGPITQVLTGRYGGPAPLGGRTVQITYRVPWGGFGVASTTTAADAVSAWPPHRAIRTSARPRSAPGAPSPRRGHRRAVERGRVGREVVPHSSAPITRKDMPINWKRIWPRKRTTVVAATGNPQVLAALWRQPGVRVREARTADGVNDLLGEARLVILDGADLARAAWTRVTWQRRWPRRTFHTPTAQASWPSRRAGWGRPTRLPVTSAACRRAWWPSPPWRPAGWARPP